MNETIQLQLEHRSIRSFKNEKLSEQQIQTIVNAAAHASTSSYLMAYSIIGVTDEKKKATLASISNQPYIKDNGHFLLFCADFYKHTITASKEQYQEMLTNLENTEHFLVATIDAAIAAQNAAIAAESIGLGICYIGSIRNDIDVVNKLFDLPKHVVPLFGLAIGFPNEPSEKKPRFPQAAYYFENSYSTDQNMINNLNTFDSTIESYYRSRSFNQKNINWTNQVIETLKTPKRQRISSFVQEKGFVKN